MAKGDSPLIVVHNRNQIIDYWSEFDMKTGEYFYVIRRMADGRYAEFRIPELAAAKLSDEMTKDLLARRETVDTP